MTLAPSDKIVSIQTKTGPVLVPSSGLTPGLKVVSIQTKTGPVLVPASTVSVGDKCLMVPDKRGKYIALKYSAGVAPANWCVRVDHHMVTLNTGELLIMGGVSNVTGMNDVWRGTSTSSTWTRVAEHASWAAGTNTAACVLPDGDVILTTPLEAWKSSDKGETWTRMCYAPGWTQFAGYGYNVQRFAPQLVALSNGHLILLGGYTGLATSYSCCNDVWRSTDSGATWTRLLDNQPPGSPTYWERRSNFGCVVTSGDNIVLGGGWTDSMGFTHALKDVWMSSDEGATWTLMNPDGMCNIPRHDWGPTSALKMLITSNDTIVVIGGYLYEGIFSYYNEVCTSTDNGASWIEWLPFKNGQFNRSNFAATMGNDNTAFISCGYEFPQTPPYQYQTDTILSTNAPGNFLLWRNRFP